MNTNINMEQLQKDAVDIFNQGFACSESVIYAIRKHFEVDIPDEAIAMSSGFPWGLGGGGCICGALAGGTMCIGYFFGRTTPGDPKINRCFELTNEFHDYFKEACGACLLSHSYKRHGEKFSGKKSTVQSLRGVNGKENRRNSYTGIKKG